MTELVNKQMLENIEAELKRKHISLFLECFTNFSLRKELRAVLAKEHSITLNTPAKLDYAIQELVGLGIIEDILKNYTNVTDISYNGRDLIINTNQKKIKYVSSTLINEEYVNKIAQKFASALRKEFTPKDPILDASLGNLRINAVHKELSPYGTTIALRVTRPHLAINEHNFTDFAPQYMYHFLKAMILGKANIIFSGEVGTGKTELQKLAMSFIPFEDKICLAEDVLESHAKELFIDKDIHSWIVKGATSYSDLIKAGLRNNPAWIIIAETRTQEAYEMIQSVLSGHRIVTTLHAINARAIPARFINMAKMGYQFDENLLLQDIYRYFDFGFHIEKIERNGKVIRYLSEVVEFHAGGMATTVFKQTIKGINFSQEIGLVSAGFKERLVKYDVDTKVLEEVGFFGEKKEA